MKILSTKIQELSERTVKLQDGLVKRYGMSYSRAENLTRSWQERKIHQIIIDVRKAKPEPELPMFLRRMMD